MKISKIYQSGSRSRHFVLGENEVARAETRLNIYVNMKIF